MAMSPGSRKEQIKIAIIGAGVSSLCLARGLLQWGHFDVRLFEARSEVGHDGSAFGIGRNGQTAMSLIDSELRGCLEKAGGVKLPKVRFMMGTGPGSTRRIADVDADQITVRRSRLLTELLKILPNGLVETNKRLAGVEQQSSKGGNILLRFEDGLETAVDALIGGDGINSIVRRHVLGVGNSATEAKWAPGYNTRMVISMVEAVSVFGHDYCNSVMQYGWIGENGFCLTDIVDDGDSMQVIAGFRSDGPVAEVYGKPFVEVPKAFWTSRLENWSWIGEKISQVIEKQDRVYAASGKYHVETPTYCNARICIMGDAAGAFPPFLGAGAGQGIEDATLLQAVFGCIDGPERLEKALEVYDRFRRPRREMVAEESRRQGVLLTGRQDHVGLDIERLAHAVDKRYDWLYEYDVAAALEGAKQQVKGE